MNKNKNRNKNEEQLVLVSIGQAILEGNLNIPKNRMKIFSISKIKIGRYLNDIFWLVYYHS